MPMIDLTYPEGAVPDARRQALVEELTTVLLRAERAPDTDFFRSVTWVYLHELPGKAVIAAGRPVREPTFRVEVRVPEGALSERRKEELVTEATLAHRQRDRHTRLRLQDDPAAPPTAAAQLRPQGRAAPHARRGRQAEIATTISKHASCGRFSMRSSHLGFSAS